MSFTSASLSTLPLHSSPFAGCYVSSSKLVVTFRARATFLSSSASSASYHLEELTRRLLYTFSIITIVSNIYISDNCSSTNMSIFHEGNEDEDEDEDDEEFTSNTRTVSITLPAWLLIAIDEKKGLAKRSTWITNDLEPKYARYKKRILREMHVGTQIGTTS